MTQRLRYTDLAPEGMAAMRAVEHYCNAGTGLSPILLELVRLRASLLNGCEYCIAMHSHELERHNEPEGRIAGVAHWRTSDAYTAHERAAFAWTEAVTNIQQGHASDAAYAEAQAYFSDADLVNLTIAITSINAWNRMAIAFRAERHTPPAVPAPAAEARQPQAPAPADSAQEPIADDGGKVEVED